MRVSLTKTAQRVERNVFLTWQHIKGYGTNNNYPQKILEIVNSSGTGKTCMDIYVKFIEGAGFTDQTLAVAKLNKKEEANTLLRKFAKDIRTFNGCSVLVKYDGTGGPESYHNIPFEHCRIAIDQDGKYTGKIAVHPDWTGITGKYTRQDDIKFINRFNPETVLEEMSAAGGPEEYLGQVYYFTADGDFEYPISPFDPIVTDMLTEESVSTVKHRNAKYNFLPSGILVRKGIRPNTLPNGTIDPADLRNQENEQSRAEILRMQGDENTSKIWVVDVDADEEKPEFITFEAKNYDKEYEYTERTVQENIGKMFLIPPILRGVDVGAGFGADLMKNAYDFMNSVVSNERRIIEVIFRDILEFYPMQFTDFSVLPIEYVSNNENIAPELLTDLTQNERRSLIGFEEAKETEAEKSILAVSLGVGGTQALTAIVTDQLLQPEQKVQLLIKLFAFTEEDARIIIGI